MAQDGKVNILLVEDSQDNLVALTSALESLGENLVQCRSGEAALKQLLKQPVAVIVLDIRLPGMDGFEAAALIRERQESRDTPILFLTGAEKSERDMGRGYALGAVDYMLKPIDPQILRAKVAVFVDLYRKTEELRQVHQQETQRRQELEQTLAQYRRLSSAGTVTEVTRGLAGAHPVRERSPAEFAALSAAYHELFDAYLEQLVVQAPKPIEPMSRIAKRMGDLGGGPRDLLDVHLQALEHVVRGAADARARAYALDGRLLALEMMGLLVDHYRSGLRWTGAEGDS